VRRRRGAYVNVDVNVNVNVDVICIVGGRATQGQDYRQ
jgi:hypothetical protein